MVSDTGKGRVYWILKWFQNRKRDSNIGPACQMHSSAKSSTYLKILKKFIFYIFYLITNMPHFILHFIFKFEKKWHSPTGWKVLIWTDFDDEKRRSNYFTVRISCSGYLPLLLSRLWIAFPLLNGADWSVPVNKSGREREHLIHTQNFNLEIRFILPIMQQCFV